MDNYFLVKNNLCQEAKHREKLGEAVWLYLYLLSYANMKKESVTFYIYTYVKRLNLDKELVRSQLKLLDAEGYVSIQEMERGAFNITINKRINTNSK